MVQPLVVNAFYSPSTNEISKIIVHSFSVCLYRLLIYLCLSVLISVFLSFLLPFLFSLLSSVIFSLFFMNW